MPLDRLLPVPPTAPDEGDRFTATFAKGWLSVITGALAPYASFDLWLNPPDDIDAQVSELIAQLQQEVIIPPQVFPETALHFHRDSVVIIGNAIAYASVTTNMFAGVWAQSAAATGDMFVFPVFLRAGLYHVTFNYRRLNSAGKLKLGLDGDDPFSEVDLYGSTLDNAIGSGNVTIPEDGNHQIYGLVNTKNASSSNYNAQLGLFYFLRTGD